MVHAAAAPCALTVAARPRRRGVRRSDRRRGRRGDRRRGRRGDRHRGRRGDPHRARRPPVTLRAVLKIPVPRPGTPASRSRNWRRA